jgi:hypothetical protein
MYEKFLEEALFFDGLRKDARLIWQVRHRYVVAMLAARYGGRRLVLKNPANATRVELLSRMYPNAAFVRIDRAKADVVASYLRMSAAGRAQFALDDIPAPLEEAAVSALYDRVIAALDAQWERLAGRRRARTHYDALTGDPIAAVADIYAQLAIPFTEAAKEAMARYWEDEARTRTPARRSAPAAALGMAGNGTI